MEIRTLRSQLLSWGKGQQQQQQQQLAVAEEGWWVKRMGSYFIDLLKIQSTN